MMTTNVGARGAILPGALLDGAWLARGQKRAAPPPPHAHERIRISLTIPHSMAGKTPVAVIIPTYYRRKAVISVLEECLACDPQPDEIWAHVDRSDAA